MSLLPMKITYIHHSSFLVETASCLLLFDYTEGHLPALPPGKPLYVFASHVHHDHYDKRIFHTVPTAAHHAQVPAVTFVLSSDIPASDRPIAGHLRTIVLGPHQTWEDELICVETLLSNDAGVAFVIAVHDGDESLYGDDHLKALKQIYFAGDLNAWNWDGDAEDMELIRIYHAELSRIDAMIFDVAFIPLDPRLGEEYTQGITDFFDVCGCEARTVVPMHCWGKYEIIAQAREKLADKYYADRIAGYRAVGDVINC